jgi:uncharacterized protein (TIGR02118 family)
VIRMSVYYPNTEGTRFDMDYYRTKHVPLAARALGDKLVRSEIDKGVDAMGPAPYRAGVHFYFESVEALQGSMGSMGEVIADVPNYTDSQPVLQVSEIVE